MNNGMSANGEEILAIDDPRVPEELRAHAAQFLVKVCFVAFDGADFCLFAEDGELVDLGYFRG